MNSQAFAAASDQIQVMEAWLDEPSNEPVVEWVRGTTRLPKLPPSPFRSAGGYLNYAGWPDCQRFLELDREIQLRGRESQEVDSGADSDDRSPEMVDVGYQIPKISSSFEIIRGLETLQFRRL